MRGPRSRAGLMAYPVGPPKEFPMPTSGTKPRPHLARCLPARALTLVAAGMVACLIASHPAAGMETGDLDTLRQAILGMVNKDRRDHDLVQVHLLALVAMAVAIKTSSTGLMR